MTLWATLLGIILTQVDYRVPATREIVEIIFASGGEASAEQIRERLSDSPSRGWHLADGGRSEGHR